MPKDANDGPYLTLAAVVSARADLLSSQLGESERVMLDMDRGRYYGLEAVAATIWDAVQSPTTVAEICAVVGQIYEGEPDEIETDTLAFVQQLFDNNLITTISA